MQVNAIIQAQTSEIQPKKINTTISHLRQSQEANARELCERLNYLTTNRLIDVQINEIDIDPTTGKLNPTIEISEWRSGASQGSSYKIADITSNIALSNYSLSADIGVPKITANTGEKAGYIEGAKSSKITIYTPEGTNHYSAYFPNITVPN